MAEKDYKMILDNFVVNPNRDTMKMCNEFIELYNAEKDIGELKLYDPIFQRMLLMLFISCIDYRTSRGRGKTSITERDLIGYASVLSFVWWGKD